jgi:hypothetical protein
LPEVRDSFLTSKTAAVLTEHTVFALKVLGITAVNITLQDGRQQLFTTRKGSWELMPLVL